MGSLAQAQDDGVVIGLHGISGIQPRREIDDLVVNEPDMFNLFLLALESLQKDEGEHQNKMGYFQVAGLFHPQNKQPRKCTDTTQESMASPSGIGTASKATSATKAATAPTTPSSSRPGTGHTWPCTR